jgi:Chaperone of endosialidase
VNGNGAVFANSYNDLNGNPIASGDVTGVAAGIGLSGGGAAGDVSLALNTSFTDGRYAALIHGHDVSQIANAARLASNTFTGTQTFDVGNLDLDPSTATAGNITKNGTPFLHNFGTDNTFIGLNAGNLTMGGSLGGNTAAGVNALFRNTTGFWNTASGLNALLANTTGGTNTANGAFALQANTTGNGNTAVGRDVLVQNTSGNDNVAIGRAAGLNATTGSNNIYLGTAVWGTAGESNTMYLGNMNPTAGGVVTKTIIAGIRGTSVTAGEPVLIDADGRLGTGPVTPAANTVGSAQVIDGSLTASDLGSNSVTSSQLAAGSVTADKVAFNYAGGTSAGGAASDVACVACVSANEVSFSFASLGANTFTGTQTIDAGNLDLDPSTPTSGNVTKNGVPILHNFGADNIFLGVQAGNFTMTGTGNTVSGSNAFYSNTAGDDTTASGANSLFNNTTGDSNTAFGFSALFNNITGHSNVAVGWSAAYTNTGVQNTALGARSGSGTTVHNGSNNVYVGYRAGEQSSNGDNNIYLGASVVGVPDESNAMYLGNANPLLGDIVTKTVIAGIRGTTITDAIAVMIDSTGRLGTISSSRRFKEDIRDMGDASRRLFQLRPVTFRYKQASGDGSKPTQYGLVAEEVAEAFPELAVRNADGVVETVYYEKLSVLLLNELQRQEQDLQQQLKEMQRQRERIDTLEQRLTELLSALTQSR